LNLSRYRNLAAIVLAAATIGFSAENTAPIAAPRGAELAELWVEPSPNRDLFYGVGGAKLAPDPRQEYKVVEIKHSGYSDGYSVVDGDKRKWSVKFAPEAHSEIVASRLLWGIGYHQPPIYYLSGWTAKGANGANPQHGARFREKKPDFHDLDDGDTWSYYDNPFAGTAQMRALLVFNAMLGNSDLKEKQNALYSLKENVEGAKRWYVARDLGQTFGRSGLLNPPRADIEAFEKSGFIESVNGDLVTLEYRGRHKKLFTNIRKSDVVWLCQRLAKLSDKQVADAFRAGGFDTAAAAPFIAKLNSKIAEGLRLATVEKMP
jgi:hypothetical protein